jgi:general secretion pathway protein K
MAFSQDSSIELNLAGSSRNGFRAYQVALAGVNMARSILEQNQDWKEFSSDMFPEDFLEEVSLSGRIVDEGGKINVNSLIDPTTEEIDSKNEERLLRLFDSLEMREDLANPILDWLDGDDIKRLDGAEDYYYQNLEEPYECGNGPLLTSGQLLLIKGIAEIGRVGVDGDKQITDFLTIYSDGKINVNTAPREVLQSLDAAMDSSRADSIIRYREDKEFSGIDDLKSVIDEVLFNRIKEIITVKSTTFSIEMEGGYQETRSRIRAIIQKSAGKTQVLYWQVL